MPTTPISTVEGLLNLSLPPAVPCAPTNVSMVTDCTNNTALVSWSPSLGAVRYMVTAQSHQNNISCVTSNLTCNLDTLTCGNSYSIQVVAMDDSCSSVPSWVQMFDTGDIGSIHSRQPNICSKIPAAVADQLKLFSSFSSLRTSERERQRQLHIQRHQHFLERCGRSRSLPGFSHAGQRRSQQVMQHHKRRMFRQQCDLWEVVQRWCHLC